MPVTPNTLLQASVQAKPQVAVNSPAAAPDLGDRASSFAQVFAKQAPAKAAAAPEPPVKSVRDNASSNTVKKTPATKPLPPRNRRLPIAANPCPPTNRPALTTRPPATTTLTRLKRQWRMLHPSIRALIQDCCPT